MNVFTRAAAAVALSIPALAVALPAQAMDIPTAKAKIINLQGEETGTAVFKQGPKGVLAYFKVTGFKPGKHGLHLHSVGQCDPAVKFASAAGHIGLAVGKHGFLSPIGPEEGDMPNIFIASDGVGEMEAFNTFVTLLDGPFTLFDEDGSSVVIHEYPDDQFTQPTGGSGPRIACGVIEKAEPTPMPMPMSHDH